MMKTIVLNRELLIITAGEKERVNCFVMLKKLTAALKCMNIFCTPAKLNISAFGLKEIFELEYPKNVFAALL